MGKHQKVLDIGSAKGHVVSHFDGSNDIITSDFTEEFNKYFSSNHFNFDAEISIPFEDSQFDVVTCSEVLEHTLFPFKIVENCYRVLKTNGRFIGTVPNFGNLDYSIRHFLGGLSATDSFFDSHIRFFDFKSVEFQMKTRFKTVRVFGDPNLFKRYLSRHIYFVCTK